MATLSGNKVKDTYESLLKLESNGVTTTLKTVEDGAGVDSALKLATDKVEVAALSFSAAPATDASELTVLLVDGSNNVVKRELDSSAFSADSGVSTLVDLTDTTITSVASGDLLAYNGSSWVNDSTPRTVAFVDNTNAVNFAVPNSNGNILFEAGSNMAITYSGNTVSFASSASGTGVFEETFVGTNSTAHSLPNANDSDIVAWSTPTNTVDSTSFHFGNSPAQLELDTTNGEYIRNITENDLIVMVDMSATVEVTTQNSNITYTLQKWNTSTWIDIKSVTRFKSNTGSQIDSFWGMFMLGSGERLRVQVSTTTGSVALSASSQFMFTVKETGNIL